MTETPANTAPALPEWGQIPTRRKIWFVGTINALGILIAYFNLLASLAFVLPGLILLWAGPVYKRKKGAVILHPVRDKVIFTILLILVLGWQVARQGGGFDMAAAKLPTCESKTAQTQLKEAVKNSPSGRRQKLEIQEIITAKPTTKPWLWNTENAIEQNPAGEAIRYLCEAEVISNAGKMPVLYNIQWIDKAKGSWYIEARF
jgi:hypothetical protein